MQVNLPAAIQAACNQITDEQIGTLNKVLEMIQAPLIVAGEQQGFFTSDQFETCGKLFTGMGMYVGIINEDDALSAAFCLLSWAVRQNPMILISNTKVVRKDGAVMVESDAMSMREAEAMGGVMHVQMTGVVQTGGDEEIADTNQAQEMLRGLGINLDKPTRH
jgi:hypothetical protein